MNKNEKVYDNKGTLLKPNDNFTDGTSIRVYYDEWYIDANSKDTMWKIEQFGLDQYKDGVMLVDFEKARN